MRYRQLGRSGLRVSVLTMGTMTFGRRRLPVAALILLVAA